ncbi:hypothetical protein SpCBS45565_g07159 [Spizellomyces sp. 'palustris']|nr:hypothetical protein SpCBS45565_g07159 [Spizellomyces sp. 'palustris']
MATTSRSSAVKRLMKELAELRNDPSPEFTAAPLEENLFEWHFTIRGPAEGGFEGGRFHGRLIFPSDYPFKPPNISFLTPNGRFEVGKKICLSITGHHPEYWRPAWGVRTALVALISFLPTKGDGAIGALDYTEEERKAYATKSREWICPSCGVKNSEALPDEADAPSERVQADPDISFTTADTGKNAAGAQPTESARDAVEEPVLDSGNPREGNQSHASVDELPKPSERSPTSDQETESASPRSQPQVQAASHSSPAVTGSTSPASQNSTSMRRRPSAVARGLVDYGAAQAGIPNTLPQLQQQVRQIDQLLGLVLFLLAILVMRRMSVWFGDAEDIPM